MANIPDQMLAAQVVEVLHPACFPAISTLYHELIKK
jgi:propanol-preferring alcohol dehydrogenase